MALGSPETPEGPGWCGQGAVRDQHGPDLSGVASQRPNRLRGLSVEGEVPEPGSREAAGQNRSNEQTAVSGPGRKNPERGRDHVNNCVPSSSDRSVDEGQVMGEARREDKPNVALSDIGRAEV